MLEALITNFNASFREVPQETAEQLVLLETATKATGLESSPSLR